MAPSMPSTVLIPLLLIAFAAVGFSIDCTLHDGCDSCVKNASCAFAYCGNETQIKDGHCIVRVSNRVDESACGPDCPADNCKVNLCFSNQQELYIIIGSVGGGVVLIGIILICCCYHKCRKSGQNKRARKYDKQVLKEREKLSNKAEQRRNHRQDRENEIRGKYGLYKKEETKTPLLG